MEIRDVIHGAIQVDPEELRIVDSRYFQRLRHIKQLGFAENSFPSATHNRYIHSLGAMKTASRVFDSIFCEKNSKEARPTQISLSSQDFARFKAIVRLSGLLHDIGHGPLSHTSEFAMPAVSKLNIPNFSPSFTKTGEHDRKATHEDYTLKIILDSGLSPMLETAGSSHGFTPRHIAALMDSNIDPGDDFFVTQCTTQDHSHSQIHFLPILRQMISSELDADRMDYLRRDSLQAGVSYGQFDFEWILTNLTGHFVQKKCFLALQHRALYALEDFLISRFHMFLMVYFHHKTVVFDELLAQYLFDSTCDYSLPSDIEQYTLYDDTHLYAHLSKSSSPWAKRIVERKPYRMLIELHTGIPAQLPAGVDQEALLSQLKAELEQSKIHYLVATSTSEFSKYFRKPGDPIYVRYDNHYLDPTFIPLTECTHLFQRYSEKRSITRLYVPPESFPDRPRHLG